MLNNNNTVPFVDLSRTYLPLKNEINQAIQKVIDSSAFILGREVEKFEIWISSPSLFSRIRCDLSLERIAVTPVFPEKLLIALDKLVRLVGKTEALMLASLFTPLLLFNENEIVPLKFGGKNLTLEIAFASTPKEDAFSLINFAITSAAFEERS